MLWKREGKNSNVSPQKIMLMAYILITVCMFTSALPPNTWEIITSVTRAWSVNDQLSQQFIVTLIQMSHSLTSVIKQFTSLVF